MTKTLIYPAPGAQAAVCRLASSDESLAKMSQYLTQAVFLEVCAHPKPGLVTRFSCGSHRDMNILTFAASSAVLARAFSELQDIGMLHDGTPAELLDKARGYGVAAEQEMLRATKGVNTQRGILFTGGLLCAAAGYCQNRRLPKEALTDVVREMTAGIVGRELRQARGVRLTAGERLYQSYGITGIRGEIEAGLPSVTGCGLPALREALAGGASLNDALVHALLSLMTVVEDSNVIWRAGLSAAAEVKETAAAILAAGSIFSAAGRELLARAEAEFPRRRISPGGSADLLSVAIGFYLLENKEFPCGIL